MPLLSANSPGAVGDPVILLDEDGRAIGSADRMGVHDEETPLHLAFSTYLFNARGEVLLTRRALTKKTWPGVWTNSCCGHPRPGEQLEEAARRRIREELGLHVGPLRMLLPDFRYRAVDASGIVENEVCPVFVGVVADEEPNVDPAEVAEWQWIAWDDLCRAIGATPVVYSPWAAAQVPLLVDVLSTPDVDEQGTACLAQFTADVDDLLRRETADLTEEWEGYAGGLGVDVLPVDLPTWLGEELIGRGKRLRVQMAYWGYVAGSDAGASGSPATSEADSVRGIATGSPAYGHLVRAAAALEALHLFALIHDDVMDESQVRRGEPAAHARATEWHEQERGLGPARRFGESIAILLGDLAHTLADRIADGLPARLRTAWYGLSVELVAGQRADITGAAAGRRDLAHAAHVATVKSGRYSIRRPLELGALAAGAAPEVLEALARFGEHLGRAFALRDDVLGVWGDPRVSGKPAGDDLVDGKPTMLLSLAQTRVTGEATDLLAQVGSPEFCRVRANELAEVLRTSGVLHEVERRIEQEHEAAIGSLDGLGDLAVSGLTRAAAAIAWRSA